MEIKQNKARLGDWEKWKGRNYMYPGYISWWVPCLPPWHPWGGWEVDKGFEEETMGKLLTVGDICGHSSLIFWGEQRWKRISRWLLCHILRTECLTCVDPKALKDDQLGESENPRAYVQRQLKRCKEETKGDPKEDPLMTKLFRNTEVESRSQAVKNKLEDMVGLNSITHKKFCDHVSLIPMSWSSTGRMNGSCRESWHSYSLRS